MVQCWDICPDRRPSFRHLATKLENVLENTEDYLEMNSSEVARDISDIVNNDVYAEYENSLDKKNHMTPSR